MSFEFKVFSSKPVPIGFWQKFAVEFKDLNVVVINGADLRQFHPHAYEKASDGKRD